MITVTDRLLADLIAHKAVSLRIIDRGGIEAYAAERLALAELQATKRADIVKPPQQMAE